MIQRNNQISEWFGHRVYPEVMNDPKALADQQSERCPFLTQATQENRRCVKNKTSLGVCTVSSTSNGPRQDWLVCPHRALDQSLLQNVVDQLFGFESEGQRIITPVSTLNKQVNQERVLNNVKAGRSTIIYFHDKLGGEISFSKTERSPEMKLDVTLVEIVMNNTVLEVGRYGILELQTMEFHGSYRYAVKNLEDSLRLFKDEFHPNLQRNLQWASEKIEGPNIANVFKRTFYQMMFKFQIGTQADCVGCVLAIPEAVWDSWQPHLGRPELREINGHHALVKPDFDFLDVPPAWIFVYDIEPVPNITPSPARIIKRIATNADSVGYYALTVAPQAAIGEGGVISLLPYRLAQRIRQWWPNFGRNTLF